MAWPESDGVFDHPAHISAFRLIEFHSMSTFAVDWLKGLGLEQYAAAFRDNDIDRDVLTELTADDLIGLGVTSIGHRANCSPP